MNCFIFYKLKVLNDHWSIVFLDDESDKCTIISDDLNKLEEYFKDKKDATLIGANNYISDDILLTSLLKNKSLEGLVDAEDITTYLPVTQDVSQGLVRNSFIDFYNMIGSIWTDNEHCLLYNYSLDVESLEKELVTDVYIIRNIYHMEDRQKFLNWKKEIIEKYNLPKDAYHYSYGRLMQAILGLPEYDEDNSNRKFTLDKSLEKALKEKNDSFLTELLNSLRNYYASNGCLDKVSVMVGNCNVKFNDQGILGSIPQDYIDVNPNSEYAYLYIDFNSFGPNILINNNWLEGIALHPERYSEVKETRINLKSQNVLEQKFYKFILNSGLDVLKNINTVNGDNVGLSLSVSGIMTMMFLYTNLKVFNVDLIECNTDGFIARCPKGMEYKIKEEVKKLEKQLNLSCDVDIIRKIVHFSITNYVMVYENGKVKHLGSFGAAQTHPLYTSGIYAVEEALREYYLNGVPVSITLKRFRDENNLKAFQIITKKKSNSKKKYLYDRGKYIPYNKKSYRLYAVREDKLTHPLYTCTPKGKYKLYKTKRGTRAKEGYNFFELSDSKLLNINDLDLTYYINECYSVIKKHPTLQTVFINNSVQRNCFIDLDGTLILDKTNDMSYQVFSKAVYGLIPSEEVDAAYYLFNSQKGCYLLQFLNLCKKNRGFGSIENFAEFLKSKNLFHSDDLGLYKKFVERYIMFDSNVSSKLDLFKDTRPLLEYLREQEYNIILYSNWFKKVQENKLTCRSIDHYFSDLCTIDDYYAKSSVKGWKDILESQKIDSDGLTIMVGNGTSDVVPKTFNIPSFIVNHTGRELPKKVQNEGIVINGFSEIIDRNFLSELGEIKSFKSSRQRKTRALK